MDDPAVSKLLLEREAKGLQVPAIARIAFSVFGGASALAGIPSRAPVAMIAAIVCATVVINLALVSALIRRRYVVLTGWIGVSIDIIIVATYPLISSAILASHGLHWSYAFKGLMVVVFITLMTINGLALRPVYPTAVGIAATIVFISMFVVARGDPSVSWADAPSFTGPAISPDAAVSQILFLIMITGIMFFLTRSARSAVVETALRQAERDRLRREHENSVMEGRLDALRNLVASLSHEMNSPLGAVKSAVDTMGVAVGRLVERMPELHAADGGTSSLLRLISETSRVPISACERLAGIVDRLNAFAALDSGEGGPVDINETVERTLTLVPPQLIGASEVVCDYHATSPVLVSAPRLNLALLTIVTNAFEAVRGHGRVRLRTEEDGSFVRVIVADNGPGISDQLRERLFEFRFDRTSDRIKVGLGLPAAYSLMKKHGGDIHVASVDGKGATFTIAMPRADLDNRPVNAARATVESSGLGMR